MKNLLLKTVMFLTALVFLGCAASLDSDDVLPFVVGMAVSGLMLALFGYANFFWDRKE